MSGKKIIRIILLVLAGFFFLYTGYRIYRHYNYEKMITMRNTYKPYTYKITVQDTSLHGYILLTPYILFNWKYGMIIIIDSKGNELLARHVNGVVYDFRQWKTRDGIRYTYSHHNRYAPHSKSGLAAGVVIILDSMLNEIKQVNVITHDDIIREHGQGTDMHDFILLSDNHYYTLVHYEKKVTNIPDSIKHVRKVVLCVPVIQEVINDSVVWQWDASHFPEFYAHTREKNNYMDSVIPQDYMHVNSMCIDPRDSNLIVSFRHECQVIKIDKKTGGILWRLGGPNSDFPLTKEQTFLFQHHVELTDSNQTLIMVDNGDSATRQSTRILEFKLDEANKKVLSFKEFSVPEYYSRYMGSVYKKDDYYFISGGSAKYVLMINRITGKKIFELKGNQCTYRAQYVDSIYGLDNVIKLKKRNYFDGMFRHNIPMTK